MGPLIDFASSFLILNWATSFFFFSITFFVLEGDLLDLSLEEIND